MRRWPRVLETFIHEQYARIVVLSQGKSYGASSDDNNAARMLELLEIGGCVARRAKDDFLNDTRPALKARSRNFVEAIMMRASIPRTGKDGARSQASSPPCFASGPRNGVVPLVSHLSAPNPQESSVTRTRLQRGGAGAVREGRTSW